MFLIFGNKNFRLDIFLYGYHRFIKSKFAKMQLIRLRFQLKNKIQTQHSNK